MRSAPSQKVEQMSDEGMARALQTIGSDKRPRGSLPEPDDGGPRVSTLTDVLAKQQAMILQALQDLGGDIDHVQERISPILGAARSEPSSGDHERVDVAPDDDGYAEQVMRMLILQVGNDQIMRNIARLGGNLQHIRNRVQL